MEGGRRGRSETDAQRGCSEEALLRLLERELQVIFRQGFF